MLKHRLKFTVDTVEVELLQLIEIDNIIYTIIEIEKNFVEGTSKLTLTKIIKVQGTNNRGNS